MKKLSLIIILSILVKISIGQNHFECGTPDNPSLKSASSCEVWNSSGAVDPSDTPIKYVRITFHVMQKAIGPDNFPDNDVSRNWLSQNLMIAINNKMGGLQPMNLPTTSPTVTDCRVRFVWANTYF